MMRYATSVTTAYQESLSRFPDPCEGGYDHSDPLWSDDYFLAARAAHSARNTVFVGVPGDPDFDRLREYTRAFNPSSWRVEEGTVCVSPSDLPEGPNELPGSLGQFETILIGGSCPRRIASELEGLAKGRVLRVYRGYYPADPRGAEAEYGPPEGEEDLYFYWEG